MEIEVCDIRYDEGLRSRVEKHIMPTIVASCSHGISGRPLVRERERVEQVRIRKLTPRECYRLMGFSDEDFDKAKEVNSDSQLYKQAGNSIVVNVLMEIFKEML